MNPTAICAVHKLFPVYLQLSSIKQFGAGKMTIVSVSSVAFRLIIGTSAAWAQTGKVSPNVSVKMEMQGRVVVGTGQNVSLNGLEESMGEVPTLQLSKLAQDPIQEATGTARSAKDAQIYRTISPSVVLIATKEGFGSGSLVDTAGDILTNWHVVKGYEYVGVVFKPTVEGKEPARDEIRRGQVVKIDEVADLALVKASDVPLGRNPIRLGDSSEIAVGMDVHAIGHPTGEAWTYTTGVISQYRQAYQWQAGGDPIKHKADVIQTQTPINPGNSGGPLLSDSGNLIGVNSFKSGGEGLNFAVSVDDVKRFVARSSNPPKSSRSGPECKPKELSRFRTAQNNGTVIALDMFCTGKDTGELVTPDDQTQAVFLRVDRKGNGRADVIFFDLKRTGRWDLSFWDENSSGQWTLVGYHDDGSLKPTRFESYAEFQKRLASR
jgi:S1-C subfamily serine protease